MINCRLMVKLWLTNWSKYNQIRNNRTVNLRSKLHNLIIKLSNILLVLISSIKNLMNRKNGQGKLKMTLYKAQVR